MPKNEYTTKFNIDISDLKKGIQQANQLMKVANSEFKAATGGMDNWGKSADGLSAKLKQLNTIHGAQKAKLEVLEAEYNRVVKAEGASSKGAQDLYIKMNNLKGEIGKTESQIRGYSSRLEEVKKAQNDLAQNTKETASSLDKLKQTISEQESKLSDLKKEYMNVALEQGKDSKEAQNLANEIKKLSGELSDSKSKLSEVADAADDLDKSLDNAADSAKDSSGGFTIMKGALADLVADGIKKAVSAFGELITASSEASKSFQAQTGATSEEMKQFNKEMTDIYKNNYGESLQDIGDKMAYVKQATGEVDPSKIKELTENAIALEDTFGSDFNETVRGVQNLMKHFGIDAQTAFDLFAKGSQEGLDYTDELGDNVAEYGGNFKQAGYSAEEYFQLLANGSKGGAYNLDKVNDSINEVKNRLADGTIEDAIGSFSADTQTAFKDWQDGKGTMKDVINSIVSDISNCTNEQEALTMAAKAFGTMGEDANLEVVKSLTTVGDTFKNVKGTMEEVKDVNYSDVGSQFEQIGRMIKTELLQPLVDVAMPAIQGFAQFVIDNFSTLAPIITGVAVAFGVLAAALGIQALINGVQKAFALLNLTMLANPFVLIVAAIAGLVAAFVLLWTKSEAFREFWINLWDGIVSVTGTIIDAITAFFTETIPNAIASMLTFFQELPENIATFLSNALSAVTTWASNMWTKAKETGTNFLNNIVEFFQQLPYKIGYFIGSVLGTIIKFATTAPGKAKEMAQNFLNNIVTFFTQLPGKVAGFLSSVINNVVNWASNMGSKAREAGSNFLNNVVNFLTQLPGKIADFLSQTISNLGSWASDMGSKGVEGAKQLFDSVTDGLEALPDNVMSIGENIVKGLWKGISGAAKWLGDKVSSFTDGVVDGMRNALGIHSPSRVMRDMVGKYIPEGIAVGIDKNAKTAINSMKNLSKKLMPAADDLKIDLGGSQPGNNGGGSSTNNAGNNYYFYQTNNSPKSLSRLDIYRQTKNQLAFAKGV